MIENGKYSPEDHHCSSSKNSVYKRIQNITLAVSLLIVILGVWHIFSKNDGNISLVVPNSPEVTHEPGKILREDFYINQIEPLLKATERSNIEAANRVSQRVHDRFEQYRSNIQEFTKDITSLSTRFSILRKMPGDWWYQNDEIHTFVQEKFEKHFFSEDKIKDDLSEILLAFQTDIVSNMNRVLVSTKNAIDTSSLPNLNIPDFKEYENDVRNIIVEFSKSSAKESVYDGFVVLITSEAAAILVETIIVRIFASMTTSATTSLIASGGATAGSTAIGGSSGSTVGPIGTAIGLGVGFVIGIVVDWYMTDKFQEKLENELTEYFNNMETEIINGNDEKQGLNSTLSLFIDNLNYAQSTVIHREIIKEYQS